MTLNKKKNKNMLECVNNKAMHLFSKQQQLLTQKTSGIKKRENDRIFKQDAIGYFRVAFYLLLPSNRVPVQKFTYEMKFYLHENKLTGETHCRGYKNGFAGKLRQRELGNGQKKV